MDYAEAEDMGDMEDMEGVADEEEPEPAWGAPAKKMVKRAPRRVKEDQAAEKAARMAQLEAEAAKRKELEAKRLEEMSKVEPFSSEKWVHCSQGFEVFGRLVEELDEKEREKEDGLVKVTLNMGQMSLRRSSIRDRITISVMSFWTKFGSEPLTFEVACNDNVNIIRHKIKEKFDISLDEIRLVSNGFELKAVNVPIGAVLCPISPFDVLFVMEEKACWTFGDNPHGAELEISDDRMSVKVPDNVHDADRIIKSNLGFESGKLWWDLRADVCPSGRANIGVVLENINVRTYVGGDSNGWSYYGNGGKKEHNGGSTDYAPKMQSGDVIRVRLDMDSRTLGFCINGHDYGVAFENLPGKVYPAISLYAHGDKFSIIGSGTF